MNIVKNKVQKSNTLQSNDQNLYFSDSDGQKEQKANNRNPSANSKSQKLTDQQLLGMSQVPSRYGQQQIQEKHGKFITKREKRSYQKKTRQNLYQRNPYNSVNFNTSQQNEWKNKMKNQLNSQEYLKLKQHFLRVLFMATRGQTPRYTLRDLGKQFNLTDDLLQQVKSKFQTDVDLAKYSKLFGKQPNKSGIQKKKKYQILLKLIGRNPFMNAVDICQKIKKIKQTIEINPSQIQSILNDEGYYMRNLNKNPKSRNNEANRQRRRLFCQKVNFIRLNTQHKVYYLGIAKFYNHMFRDKGWTQQQYLIQPEMEEGFSLMAVTQINGEGTWKFQKQIHEEKVFQQTLIKLLQLLIKNKQTGTKQLRYLIFDFKYWLKYNTILNKVRKQFGFEMMWIPPFSEPLNPLQFWFQEIKKYLKSSGRLNTEVQNSLTTNGVQVQNPNKQHFIKQIYEQLCQIFKQKYNLDFDFSRFIEYSHKYYQLGQNKEFF